MRRSMKSVAAVLSGLLVGVGLLSGGCNDAEPLEMAWQPVSHPALSPMAYAPPPTIKEEPETEAMQKVSEETRRKYFKAEIDRTAREDAYFESRRQQVAQEQAQEEAAQEAIYSYCPAPEVDYAPVVVAPVEPLPANCTVVERRQRRLGLYNVVVFGALGGIIGHQVGHRDEGIAIGASYGLLHDLACDRR
ncbi:MAG: hypothetical protein ACREJ2_05350 [Planctomycetota bacterium]